MIEWLNHLRLAVASENNLEGPGPGEENQMKNLKWKLQNIYWKKKHKKNLTYRKITKRLSSLILKHLSPTCPTVLRITPQSGPSPEPHPVLHGKPWPKSSELGWIQFKPCKAIFSVVIKMIKCLLRVCSFWLSLGFVFCIRGCLPGKVSLWSCRPFDRWLEKPQEIDMVGSFHLFEIPWANKVWSFGEIAESIVTV